MKVLENTETFPPYKYYENVEDKFLNFKPLIRVLPARYFNEPQLVFTFKKRYEPGEHKHFPEGGFEVCASDGGVYNFALNEVIVHPFALGMTKFFSKQLANKEKVTTGPKGKRGRPAKDPSQLKEKQIYVPTGGKRGRKPLDPEVKAAREAAQLAKSKKSGGKRGRPKKQAS